MKKAIAKQMRFIFFIPLVVGIIHTLFALKGLATVIPYEIAVPLLISIGVYSVIYIGYYYLTVRSYFGIFCLFHTNKQGGYYTLFTMYFCINIL